MIFFSLSQKNNFLNQLKYLYNKDGKKWQSTDWIVHQGFCNEKRCGPRFISLLKKVTPWEDDDDDEWYYDEDGDRRSRSILSRMKTGAQSFISQWFL